MDGEEHAHVQSEIDVHVKRLVVEGAFQLVSGGGLCQIRLRRWISNGIRHRLPRRRYRLAHGSTMQQGVRRRHLLPRVYGAHWLARSVVAQRSKLTIWTLVTKWKHQGYRQEGNVEEDKADLGVLDFATLLQEVACVRSSDEDPMEALASLLDLCDP